jgi:hypothetical protein
MISGVRPRHPPTWLLSILRAATSAREFAAVLREDREFQRAAIANMNVEWTLAHWRTARMSILSSARVLWVYSAVMMRHSPQRAAHFVGLIVFFIIPVAATLSAGRVLRRRWVQFKESR